MAESSLIQANGKKGAKGASRNSLEPQDEEMLVAAHTKTACELAKSEGFKVLSTRGMLPCSFDEAKQRYKNSVNLIIRMVTTGAASKDDAVWANTCEWLLSCKASLHVLSPRHDTNTVVASRGINPALVGGYFGEDWAVPLGSASESTIDLKEYPDRLSLVPWDHHGLEFKTSGKILIIDPMAYPEREVKKTIIHEVQHGVEHQDDSSPEGTYRSEFRARWVSGQHGSESTAAFSDRPTNGFRNPRQAAIATDLINDYPALNAAFHSGKIKNLVYSNDAPDGINLLNSLRIDNLYLALAPKRPNVRNVETALAGLRLDDKTAIRSPGSSAAWRAHIGRKDLDLSSTYKVHLMSQLGIHQG